jgi:hypothetical protein
MTPVGRDSLTWSCEIPFPQGAPDWSGMLATLDQAGLMAPPTLTPSGVGGKYWICEGESWTLRVSNADGNLILEDQSGCGPQSLDRQEFERQLRGVLDSVYARSPRRASGLTR